MTVVVIQYIDNEKNRIPVMKQKRNAEPGFLSLKETNIGIKANQDIIHNCGKKKGNKSGMDESIGLRKKSASLFFFKISTA